MYISKDIELLAAEMVPLRRAFHQNPQIGYQETFANARIRAKLEEWNIPYESGLAGTGIVATIESLRNASGKTIGLRADMDALPIQEVRDIPWKSRNDGVMHACGHDGHMSILLGTASWLQNNRDRFDGTVKLIFQPAEEGVGGAMKMLEEGLFEKHHVDAVFGLHNWPSMPLGVVGVRPGAIMASYNSFTVNITGKASHAAQPEQGINAGVIAGRIFADIHTKLPQLSLADRFVVAPTVIQAGIAKNIVPGEAVVHGSIRTLNKEDEARIVDEVRLLSQNIAAEYGGSVDITASALGAPTVNDPAEARIVGEAARDALGAENVDENVECAMIAEDFCYMLEKRPGAYFWLGQGEPEDPASPHNQALHNNRYEFNDAALAPGIAVFTRLVEKRLPLAPALAPA